MNILKDELFLEPCPFCGSECMIKRDSQDSMMYIECIYGNHINGTEGYDIKKIVDDWNTRYKGDNK